MQWSSWVTSSWGDSVNFLPLPSHVGGRGQCPALAGARRELSTDPCPCFPLAAACKESKRPLEVSQHSEEMGLILGICAGGLVVLIILLGAIIVVIRKG